jgi:hypothetical protein
VIVDELIRVAREADTTPASVALAWVRGRSGVTSTLIGARNVEQLEQNLASISVQLSADQVRRLDALSQPQLGFPTTMLAYAGSFMHGGIVIAQRYELIRLLGEGGMGVVWSALHTVTQKPVALKFLKAPASQEMIARFIREARAVGSVRHPNVIEIHDIFTLEDGLPAMVMDLLEGESLADRLERSGAFAWGELQRIMVPVLSAVGAAHAAGVVHRDLKPVRDFTRSLAAKCSRQQRQRQPSPQHSAAGHNVRRATDHSTPTAQPLRYC